MSEYIAEMKTPMLLLLMMMMVFMAADVNGDMFTALVDLENLLHAERQVAVHLRQFVDEQTRHLRQLTLYVQ